MGIRIPSGMGGLTVFKEEYKSKIQLSPTLVMILIAIFSAILIALRFIL